MLVDRVLHDTGDITEVQIFRRRYQMRAASQVRCAHHPANRAGTHVDRGATAKTASYRSPAQPRESNTVQDIAPRIALVDKRGRLASAERAVGMPVRPNRVTDVEARRQEGERARRRISLVRHAEQSQIHTIAVAPVPLLTRKQPHRPVRVDEKSGHLGGQGRNILGKDMPARGHDVRGDKESRTQPQRRGSAGRNLKRDRGRDDVPLPAIPARCHGIGFDHSKLTFIADMALALPITAKTEPDSTTNSQPNSTATFVASKWWSSSMVCWANALTPASASSSVARRPAISLSWPPTRGPSRSLTAM